MKNFQNIMEAKKELTTQNLAKILIEKISAGFKIHF